MFLKDLYINLRNRANVIKYQYHFRCDIDDGFITEFGEPLKCIKCHSTEMVKVNECYYDNILHDYDIKCNKCDKVLAYWSTGNYIQ